MDGGQECPERKGARCPNLGNIKLRGICRDQPEVVRKLGPWKEGRKEAQRAGRELTERGQQQSYLILHKALANKKEKPLDLATKSSLLILPGWSHLQG